MSQLFGLIAQVNASPPSSSPLADLKTVVETVQAATTAVAVVVGAIWAYFKFVKERTYRPRLEVGMSGEWRSTGKERLLHARVTVKNIGTSVVELAQEGTGLRLSRISSIPEEAGQIKWQKLTVFPILAEHQWIEPGETVSDDLLVTVPVPASEPTLFETRLVWTWRESEGNIVVFARKLIAHDAKMESGEETSSVLGMAKGKGDAGG
ncbi:MAG: hypothetical protein M3N68_03975 [Actinomycetota bacterium]|nr:hypothetical protein [Actinomycetota bacterium]